MSFEMPRRIVVQLELCDFPIRTHHHQMAILRPINHRFLTALEVNEPLSAGLDVKTHTTRDTQLVKWKQLQCILIKHFVLH